MIYFSYYPTYELLDNLVEKHNPKQMNIFVDLKNCLSGLYFEQSIKNMYDANKDSKCASSDIFQSWIDFIVWHYNYMYKRELNLNLFIITDVGESMYHTSLYKKYKEKRSITRFKTISSLEYDAVKKLSKINIEAIMKTSKMLFNVHGIYLSYCESDFVPHYLIRKNYLDEDQYLNIIYSSDHDMIQTLEFGNTYQFFRGSKGVKEFYNKDNWFSRFNMPKMPVNNYLYHMTITGDTSDDIPGVSGVGLKRAWVLLENKDIHSLDELKAALQTEVDLKNKQATKVLNQWDVIERNYKLMSFDALSEKITVGTLEKLNNYDADNKFTFAESVQFIQNVQRELN